MNDVFSALGKGYQELASGDMTSHREPWYQPMDTTRYVYMQAYLLRPRGAEFKLKCDE